MAQGIETSVSPPLTVKDTAGAVDFYRAAFGANELTRITAPNGAVVAELSIDGATFVVADEAPDNGNVSPASVGRTTVRISLIVADPDAVAARAIAAGAREMFRVADQSYGFRQGRVVDPFDHHWLIGRPLEAERSSGDVVV